MEGVCTVQLNEGAAADWSDSLKRNIIKHYINTQSDLQELLKKKTNYWSIIKGYFQWIYAILFGS